MTELKPCKKCGSNSGEIFNEYIIPGDDYWLVECQNCGYETPPLCHTEAEAIEAWNRRTPNESCE